ncbi:BnaCnng58750D [Brassica napus]|uniref:BnaCnng58750D protein n=1 Tax=Brassica napus TaxID=3708 RepID=A0A078JNP1_BRANA|nr:BnaCnng58750D [Brassica napus]
MMDDLDACRSFPWGRLTFEDAIKEIKHVMNYLKGECIPDLGKTFRIYSDDASEDCPRMCKSRFTKSSLKGYPLEDIYAAVGDTKVINSVLVPTIGKQIMLARIIDEEREYDCQGSPSDTWNYWLNVKQKNIWWKELYELDQAARGVLPKNKDKEKVTFAEGSSSNSGLDSRLQGLEERILEFMGEGFVGLHVTSKVEPSHGEDMDFRQWDYEGEKEKENSEADEQDTEDSESESESESEDDQAEVEGKEDQEEEVEGKESETREQEKEKKESPKDDHNEPRVETNRTDETPTPPRGNQTEETPTPPRGRTKAMAARRLVTRPMEEEPGKGVEVVAEEAVETEGKSRKKVAEEENKEEEAVKEQAGEIVEEYTEEEKQRWIIAVYKEAPSPWIMHRCKENAAVAVPKKSGRPKKKSQWVQTPFTEGKKRKTKTYAYVWKTKFTGVTMPKNE